MNSSIVWSQTLNSSIEKPSIIFIVPADEGFPFWESEATFAKAVAKTHNLKLEVVYTPRKYRNRFDVVNFVDSYLSNLPYRPDLIVTSFWLGSEQQMLAMLNNKKIPTITINSNLSAQQFAILGHPREKYPLWLAHLSPNDTDVGELLGELLIDTSRKKKGCGNEKCKIDVFAITGLNYSAVSLQRVEGLKKAIKKHQWSSLINVVYGNWKRETVSSMMNTITKRHPNIDAYWVASDIMAYGINDGLQELNQELPDNTLVGSIDWSPLTVTEIQQDRIDFSLGGHFMEAGWALMLYVDYKSDKDFKDELGTEIKVPFSLLEKTNIDELGPFLSAPEWTSANLKQYSKSSNPQLKQYNFEPIDIIKTQISSNQAQ